ncbi:class F sortase [Actinoplanes sp. NPDC051859]|uniref:class F sortase n=1 Tax=Actinoplanes sp. NPDC051859 TaxID=3363909 RepID=UPI0037ACFE06
MTVRAKLRRAFLPAAVSALTAVVVGAGYLAWHSRPAAAPEGVAVAVPVPSNDPDPFGTARPTASGPPTRLRVAAAGIDTALETLRLGPDGELVPPRADDRAGWYAAGTAPGDIGPAVLAGHVDSVDGPAVFYRLREIRVGDRIEVTRGGRKLVFTVTATAWYPKDAFPAERVYGPTPDRQLRLITCGGVFDRSLRSYRDNLVVYAATG